VATNTSSTDRTLLAGKFAPFKALVISYYKRWVHIRLHSTTGEELKKNLSVGRVQLNVACYESST